jgi:hypothetical protein
MPRRLLIICVSIHDQKTKQALAAPCGIGWTWNATYSRRCGTSSEVLRQGDAIMTSAARALRRRRDFLLTHEYAAAARRSKCDCERMIAQVLPEG